MLSLPTGLFNRITPRLRSESAPAVQNLLRPIGISPVDTFKYSLAHAPSGEPHREERVSPAITVKGILLMLHFSGALLILGLTAVQKIRLRKLALRSAPVQDPVLVEAYDELIRSIKLWRRPELLISKDNNEPIAFGVWSPVIVLPQSLVTTLPLSGIRVVLGHELAHHRRRDPWVVWLQAIISAIWWFNPIYWLLSRSLRSAREDCCDDMALASGFASREAYCRTLLQSARAAFENNAMTRAAFAYLGKSQPLRRRFKRIMGAKRIRAPKLAMTGMLAVFALALVLLPGIEPCILAQNAAPVESVKEKLIPTPQRSNDAAKAEVQSPDPKTTDELMKNIESNMEMLQAPDRDQKNAFRALRYINEFLEKFPNNGYTPQVKKRKTQVEENLALGDFEVVQFYLERGVITGAFTRLKHIKDNYPNFSRMNEVDFLVQQAQQMPAGAASNYYRKWLFEDVVYIIAPEEKNEFIVLKTDQERESFIERFWVRRDPSFKAEHYRRIAYANEYFTSSAPGWKTDRGRIYIRFGKPDELEAHPTGGNYAGVARAYPYEKWRYRHIDGVGDDIEIEFVDRSGIGEYRLNAQPQGEK
jgi:GWxTD domain-containing protein